MSSQSFRQIIGLAPSTATITDSTLIIVDAQNEYAQGLLRVQEVDQSRKVIADLLSRYRYMAHVCVSTTARTGAELGYDVLVVRDGVSDRAIPGVEANVLVDVALKEVTDAFGTVIASGEIKGVIYPVIFLYLYIQDLI
ncbi:predicted protein [Aspergillus nidulans FGSC A4]|uniref:Isochorismatase-like protein asqB n=1 Tax=Emericella nidulans (strain FGSC A4 / ATCC 38163 / CBS 112.46 / NRRL 194 / M139) TaxID=227321 RepID=ASQB_EMENI|nr:hypothetical protein [Aspergillus nidulans FGSC A4]Q5AR45.1 RecName: Full=Isochorismatase-like protein asqB; AltName: Full=4'-methoxyviridicatin/aspoquinolone biosynthesis cluster protein asqB; AltName: Full=Aspoquinolone biosynthesis protein B [Aspergillus nidulans FGSC A4]EAA61526.1 predicted protein [Aspergillus nidulans FGSC A4]CBF82263.1 TPA: isochorismatase family hydrolase, putative (AFU_orthologue; AFUA_7G06610) [Aspergillus nidulans FGSC A4]|eukprot:XP_682504.1 predicted protein [Aspergillus nidulans FGSC A4]